MRHAAASVGGADGQVGDRRDLHWIDDHLVVAGDAGVQPVQLDLLLVAGAGLPAGDRQHRRVIQPGVLQPGQQVHAARPRGCQADADPPGRLGVPARHPGGGLLVPHQDEAHPVLMPSQPFHDPADAVTRHAEDCVGAPVGEPLDQGLGSDPCHDFPLVTSGQKGLTCPVPPRSNPAGARARFATGQFRYMHGSDSQEQRA